MIQAPAYQRTRASEKEELKAIFGAEHFERYFRSTTVVSLTAESFTREQGEAIVRLLADPACRELLRIQISLLPTEQYRRDRILDVSFSAKAKKAESKGLAKPFPPCVKQRA